MSVMLVTSLGELVVDLFTDRCPLTCKNFLKLCKIKYYNGCLFHTIQKDFTAQTGDPTGTGSGGHSIYKYLYGDQARFFGDEIHLDLKHAKTGTVAMASAGENLNASQFYITLRDDLDYLDGKHTVFGEVAEGLETLTRINEAYVDENGRPYKNIRIKHTYILDDPFDDPSQLAELIPDASPEGKPKDEIVDDVRLEDDWVPMDEQLGQGELEELLREKVAHSSAVVLEAVGDIPDSEIKPPDNVLFVCKLNPVTEDEDLHTIFSRFGTVTSAEVIRDYKTGDSLCYAFIEFEDKEACEQAYFKMDNALIDDRRIHVDFSQSVAKLWSQYRRKGQKGTGGSCFKCGSVDHIAKDCPGEPTTTQHTKYILKDGNAQRGGGDNSRYEMVFAADADASQRRNKRQRDHVDRNEKKSVKPDGVEDRDDRKRGRHDQNGRWSRNKEHGEGEGYHGRSPYDGRDRSSPARDKRDYSRKVDGASRRDKRDEPGYDKKHADNAVHRDKRDGREHKRRRENDPGNRDKREVKEYEKRRQDDVSRGDHRESGRSRDDDLRGNHMHHTGQSDSRRDDRDELHGRRMSDRDSHKVRSEDRDREKRSFKGDDAHGHDRDQGRRHRR